MVLHTITFADREIFDAPILATNVDLPSLSAAAMGCAVELARLRPGKAVHRCAFDLERAPELATVDRYLAHHRRTVFSRSDRKRPAIRRQRDLRRPRIPPDRVVGRVDDRRRRGGDLGLVVGHLSALLL